VWDIKTSTVKGKDPVLCQGFYEEEVSVLCHCTAYPLLENVLVYTVVPPGISNGLCAVPGIETIPIL
jgi:hypothetical protein